MCGIAGIVHFGNDGPVDAGILRRMCGVIAHRGPDDERFYTNGAVGLGMRRLSIIDVSSGHQPISNEDGSIWLVYNGEIYNHVVVREELIRKGHVFRTRCDTETIVHAYEEYGRDCVLHLRGMFAFALWDARHRRLFAARDRLGIKPFYYIHNAGGFLFGSEIKAILTYSAVRAEFNRSMLPEYLAFGYLSGPETFFTGIHKLMPGHWLELDGNGSLHIEPYWDLAVRDEQSRSESYWVQGYRERLEQAVSSHLMSDVPLGVFLSGGVDSSAVAALTTKIRQSPIETFSVGYGEQPYSELPYARAVADHIGSVHQEVQISREQFLDALPHLIWHEDEPIAWPSSVALYFVAKLARERVTVVLTGEGADETLAGYTRYAFTLKNEMLDRAYRKLTPSAARSGMRRFIRRSSVLGAGLRRKLEHTFLARDGESWASFYFDNFFSAFSAADQATLLLDDDGGAGLTEEAYGSVLKYWSQSDGPLLRRLLYTDIKTYLVELLMKQDNMSMAASIESRVPFLDHELVEFAAGIPVEFQVKGLTGKRVLKKAMEGLLPPSILYRPKLGFPTPWSRWIEGPHLDIIEQLVQSPRSVQRALFRPEAVTKLFEEHRGGHRDHYDRIWRLLNLELWFRVMIDGEAHDAGWSAVADESAAPIGAGT